MATVFISRHRNLASVSLESSNLKKSAPDGFEPLAKKAREARQPERVP